MISIYPFEFTGL